METRRDFIKKAAALSGATGVWGLLPESIQRARAIDPAPGTTWLDAEHVVILMQENRSFDHCYGTLQGVRGFNDPRAISLPNKNPVWLQTNVHGETYAPFRLDIHETKATWMGCLPHTWQSQVDARNGGKYDRWLDAKASLTKGYAKLPLTLGHYTRADVPFYYALADAFTICDQHFCSSITGTMPNRLYFWTGTTRGPDAEAPAKVRNEEIEYESSASWTTFPERLEDHGISWKIYQNETSLKVGLTREEHAWLSNFGDNPLEWFTQYHAKFSPAHRKYIEQLLTSLPAQIAELEAKLQSTTIPSESETTKRDLDKAKALLQSAKADHEKWSAESFEKLSPREKNLHEKAFCTNVDDPSYHELTTLTYRDGETERQMHAPKGDVLFQFRQDVEQGKLPAVSWLVAPENFSDHPDAAWYGAWYVSEVFDILTRNPDVWKKTVFILTYDENDGYFDHVPPFVAPDPRNAGTGITSKEIDTHPEYVTLAQEMKHHAAKDSRESPIGLGYRVPLVIASPWSRGGYVCSQVFDHTSTLQLLEKFVSHKCGAKVEETNITKWRRAVSGDLTSAFRPYNGEKIPLPTPVARDPFLEGIHKAQFKSIPSDFQPLSKEEIAQSTQSPKAPWMPKQEPGTRPSCALPYELTVNGRLSEDRKSFEITFAAGTNAFGESSAGSPFTVYALRNHRGLAAGEEWDPMRIWNFAVTAGDQISYAWPLEEFEGGEYHLRVCGPNGFLREFRGSKDAAQMEIDFAYQRRGSQLTGEIELMITNKASQPVCTIEIKDHGYQSPLQSTDVPAGSQKRISVTTAKSFGWYDFSVRLQGSEGFERQYAGRVETGKSSMTDPVMGGV